MNLPKFLHLSLTGLILATIGSLCFAQTMWTAGTGDFLTPGNWSAGVPTIGVEGVINNGGTAQLTTDTLVELDSLDLGNATGTSGSFEMSNGMVHPLEVSIGDVGMGTFSVSGGYLDSAGSGRSIFVGGHDDVLGNPGTGILNQTGGFIRSADDIQLGNTGTGTANLEAGVMRGGFTVVGKFGTGTWNQSGGVFDQDFGDFEIGDGGRPDQDLVTGPRVGTVNFTGGVIQTSGHFALGNRSGSGTVNVSGGALTTSGDDDGNIYIGRGMNWEGMTGAGGPTELRVTGDESIIVATGSLLMNLENVASTSTLVAEITGPTHTTIQVAGDADITNGILRVELDNYSPVSGDSWTIIEAGADLTTALTAIDGLVTAQGPLDLNGDGTAGGVDDVLQHLTPIFTGTRVGMFASEDFSLAPLAGGLAWEVEYQANAVLLHVTGEAALAGDLNGDNLVNFGDLTPFVLALTDVPAYEAMFPTLDRVARCDTSGDGMCNFGDLTPFVDLLTAGPASGSAVPEPGTTLLLVIGALAFAMRFQGRIV
jgi:hypothetical protein